MMKILLVLALALLLLLPLFLLLLLHLANPSPQTPGSDDRGNNEESRARRWQSAKTDDEIRHLASIKVNHRDYFPTDVLPFW